MTDRELMQMALDALSPDVHRAQWAVDEDIEKAIKALRARLAQPDRRELQAQGKHPAPCARYCESTAYEITIRRLENALRNAAKREWVGLTEDERHDIMEAMVSKTIEDHDALFDVIEAKLKEKNA